MSTLSPTPSSGHDADSTAATTAISTQAPTTPGQRRPSISSLSSASGYASSSYGGPVLTSVIHPNTTGNSLLGSRVPSARHPGSLTPLSQSTTPLHHTGGNSSTAAPQQGQANLGQDFNPSWLPQQTNSLLNVTPWIEQQAQVSPVHNMTYDSPGTATSGTAVESNSTATAPDQSAPTNLSVLARAVPMNQSSTVDSINGSVSTERQSKKSHQRHSHAQDDEEIIPTAIVIKNIPFAIKKEQLLDFMSKLNLPLPYAFNYHFDSGVFRGLAFANFNTTDETSLVVNMLNGREIGGRKLRVEYKKMLPPAERERIEREKRERRGQLEEQHRSTSQTSLASLYSIASAPATTQQQQQQQQQQQHLQGGGQPERVYVSLSQPNQLPQPPAQLDLNSPDTLELYTKLVVFRDEPAAVTTELVFVVSALTNQQRRAIPLLCQFLGLTESLESSALLVIRRGPEVIYQQLQQAQQSQSQQQPIAQQQAQAQTLQFPPQLMRSHSHSILNSANQLSMNTGRYRQQSPRAVSSQGQFASAQSSLLSQGGFAQTFTPQQQQQPLHHSSSSASLNGRQTSFAGPPTPNQSSRIVFSSNGALGAFGNGLQGFNHPQLTGGSTTSTSKGLDDLYVGMENITFDR